MKKTFILIAIGSIAFLSSCRKNTKAFDGPSISDILSDFKLLSAFQS
jgi:hypothetical protein